MYSFWPKQTDSNPFTEVLNQTQKYVASNTLAEPLPWMNSTLVSGDAAVTVAALKEQAGEGHRRPGQRRARPDTHGSRSRRRVHAADPSAGTRVGPPPVSRRQQYAPLQLTIPSPRQPAWLLRPTRQAKPRRTHERNRRPLLGADPRRHDARSRRHRAATERGASPAGHLGAHTAIAGIGDRWSSSFGLRDPGGEHHLVAAQTGPS